MKILAIGDFHGEFLGKFNKIIKRENIDLVVSLGDYPPFSMDKLFWKEIYAEVKEGKELWDYIGKKKYKKYRLRDHKFGEEVMKKLNKLPAPVLTIAGNHDESKWPETIDKRYYKIVPKRWKWAEQDFFTPMVKKYRNIKDINYSYAKFEKFIFIGGGPSSFPGRIKNYNYRWLRKKLDNLFKKYNKENKQKRVIFISHNVPYNTKIDVITSKKAHKKARGRHYGSKLVRRVIDKWQPILHIGGHLSENQGKDKIKKTTLINPGAAHEGKAVVIEIDEGKIKKVKFIK